MSSIVGIVDSDVFLLHSLVFMLMDLGTMNAKVRLSKKSDDVLPTCHPLVWIGIRT